MTDCIWVLLHTGSHPQSVYPLSSGLLHRKDLLKQTTSVAVNSCNAGDLTVATEVKAIGIDTFKINQGLVCINVCLYTVCTVYKQCQVHNCSL